MHQLFTVMFPNFIIHHHHYYYYSRPCFGFQWSGRGHQPAQVPYLSLAGGMGMKRENLKLIKKIPTLAAVSFHSVFGYVSSFQSVGIVIMRILTMSLDLRRPWVSSGRDV